MSPWVHASWLAVYSEGLAGDVVSQSHYDVCTKQRLYHSSPLVHNGCKMSEVGTLCSGWVIAVLKPRPLLFPDHPHLEPRHFVDEKAVSENHKDYMFLQCILFITEVRATPAC